MKIRKLFAAAAVSAGLAVTATPAFAAEPAKKPAFAFSTMKAVSPETAKAKAEAWLKSIGKFDEAAFNKVWSDEKRSVLDRTADALALGNTEVAAMLANVRKQEGMAPAEVPSILKDEKQDNFFRTNVSLAFAKAAAGKKVYEEALEALKSVNPEFAVDPASYFFFRAVSEHATMKKDAATTSIVKLLDDVADAPSRYTMVATLMFFDMQNWAADPKDLSNIERLMDNSGRRLDLARGGEKTQDIQKKIVFRLDELIKELEAKNKPGTARPTAATAPVAARSRATALRAVTPPSRPRTPRTASSWAAAAPARWTRRSSAKWPNSGAPCRRRSGPRSFRN